MKKFMQKKLQNEKGLTLIELLAVIVILAIIAAIAVPAIGNIIENSRYSAVKSDATNVLSSANVYFAENADKVTVTLETLNSEGYLNSLGKLAKADVVDKGTKGAITLTAASVNYSGSKTIKFTGATSEAIAKDTTKGSSVKTVTITTEVVTTK